MPNHSRTPAPPVRQRSYSTISDAFPAAAVLEFALRVNANGPLFQLALLHGEAGNLDEAFHKLDSAIARRDPALVHLAIAPQWDCLRVDVRFRERLAVMGLTDAAERAQRVTSRPRDERIQ